MTDAPPVKLSGGPLSGYTAEICVPPLYFSHSPLRNPKNNAHKDAETVTRDALALWSAVQNMRLSDFKANGLPTLTIVIRNPTPQESDAYLATRARNINEDFNKAFPPEVKSG